MEGRLRRGRTESRDCCGLYVGRIGCAQSEDLTNHQSYLQSWLKALRNDNRFIFKASTAANKAADFVLSFSHQPEPELVEMPF